jgi:predicted ATPase
MGGPKGAGLATKTKSTPGPFLNTVELIHERIRNDGAYPYNIAAVRNLGKLTLHPRVTFLVGENGSGKSTLVEALAVACGMNPEGGGRNFNFSTRKSHSKLGDCLRIGRPPSHPRDTYFLRAESFYNVATEIEKLGITGYGTIPLHEQSHGESFFALLQSRFRDHGLYFMDEPESALSPSRQLGFLAILHDCCRRGCQFVIATHSPVLIAYPDAVIYALDADGIHRTEYTETDNYRVSRGFLNNPEGMLKILMAEPQSRRY